MAEGEKTIQVMLSLPILLADRVIKSAREAESTRFNCDELAKQLIQLTQLLRSTVRLVTTPKPTPQVLYELPIRRIVSDATKNLERALTLIRKCRHGNFLRRLFTITSAADFKKLSNLLDSSIADITWLLSIYDPNLDIEFVLPPIASNDPILAWVWSCIASLQIGTLRRRIEAAGLLASMAETNDRDRQAIVQEGGIPPLLKLLKEGTSPEAQIASATVLYNLATDKEKVAIILNELGIPIIVKVLGDSPMKVQVVLVNLVSRMAEIDRDVQEGFGRENVARPLVTLLMYIGLEEPKPHPRSIHSLVQINKEMTRNTSGDGSSRGGHYRKEREAESPEVKLSLKTSCAQALWKLSSGSLLNSQKITETKALLCLAKLIEKEKGELQFNCLMTVMELAAVAESNADLKRMAFKTNSPAARAVLDQLLRVLNEETDPALLILAIRSIGFLSRMFSAKETQTMGPLVAQLGHRNVDVVREAAVALEKFANPQNYNCIEHSKAIIEFNGVPRLINLLRSSDRNYLPELLLLCYLALHVGNSKALEEANVLNVLEEVTSYSAIQHPHLRELFARALHNLTLFQCGAHTNRQSYAP